MSLPASCLKFGGELSHTYCDRSGHLGRASLGTLVDAQLLVYLGGLVAHTTQIAKTHQHDQCIA